VNFSILFLSLLYYIVYSKLTNKLTGPSLELYNNVKLDVDTTFVFSLITVVHPSFALSQIYIKLYGNANMAQQS
jgi:hypothetical protein